MKALILAAGLGTRLAPLTDNCPKSLVAVNGKPILFQQIDNLIANEITDITIVCGYKKEVLIDAVNCRYKGIQILVNDDYSTTNNMYSAYLAKDSFEGQGFLMMNADVFFDSSVITGLLNFPAENAIVTDIGTYIEESMKVCKEDGRLTAISKSIPAQQAYGTSIDVYKFSPDGGAAFFKACEKYIVHDLQKKLWSEVALNDILSQMEFAASPVNGRWLEIDNHQDLAAAEKLFSDVAM